MNEQSNALIKFLIYVSTPVEFTQPTVDAILKSCRKRNTKNDITGALVCRSDLYLQYLEGPADRIDETYQRIQQDDRHTDAVLLLESTRNTRLFGRWAMRDAPPKSWMWTREEVAAGVVKDLPAQKALEVFTRLAGPTGNGKVGA
jgi:hypothetical protein